MLKAYLNWYLQKKESTTILGYHKKNFQSLLNENLQLSDKKFKELDKLEKATYLQLDFKIIPED